MDVLNVQLYFDLLDVRCFKQRLGSLEGALNASLVQINVLDKHQVILFSNISQIMFLIHT